MEIGVEVEVEVILGDGAVKFQVPYTWGMPRFGYCICSLPGPAGAANPVLFAVASLAPQGKSEDGEVANERTLEGEPTVVEITDDKLAEVTLARREMFSAERTRVLVANHVLPAQEASEAERAACVRELAAVLRSAEFAGRETALDRIAEDRDHELVHLWNVVHLRIARGWVARPEDHGEAGPTFCIEDPADEDALTLWATLQIHASETAMGPAERRAMGKAFYEELSRDQDPAFGPAGQRWVSEHELQIELEIREVDENDGQPLQRRGLFRHVWYDRGMLVAIFWFVRLESRIGEPRSDAALALAEREVRNAWITPPV